MYGGEINDMSTTKIIQANKEGKKTLKQVSTPVTEEELKSKEIKDLVKNLKEVMYKFNSVGISAPQIGVLKRVVVIDVDYINYLRQFKKNPIIMINPKIVSGEGFMVSEEGCLSFMECKTIKRVKRSRRVKVAYTGLDGKPKTIIAVGGILASCLQHELDHLDGVLISDLEEVQEE